MDILKSIQSNSSALSIKEQTISFKALKGMVDEKRKVLAKLPEGVIALTAHQNIQFIVQFLAAFKNQQPVLIFSNSLTSDEAKKRIQGIKNAISVSDEGEYISINKTKNSNAYHPKTAIILFTSGSSGQSKAVQLSYENIMANWRAVINTLDFKSAKDQLLFLPLCYSFGLLGQLIPALMTGMKTHVMADFSEINGLLVEGTIPQMWSGVPSHWIVLAKLFSSFPELAKQITHVISAGDKLPLLLRQAVRDIFTRATIYNNYGLTEASPRVLCMNSRDPDFFSEAVGYPVGDWQIKRSDEGELCVRGSQVMLGYIGDENNQKVSNGWLNTGDMGEISHHGLVFINGRADRSVNIDGEKINLNHIESLLQKTGIKLVVIDKPDEIHGRRLVICVDKINLTSDKEALYDLFNEAMQPWNHGFEITFFNGLPNTSRGKIDYNVLRAHISKRNGR